jgi:hypothetical protein
MHRTLIGIAAAASALCAVTACGAPSVTTTPTVAAPSGSGTSEARPAPSAAAGVGDTIELTGQDAVERVAVTLVQVVDPAQATNEFDTPPAGTRLVGAQWRLRNVGTATYQDAPDNSATVADTRGQTFRTTVVTDITAGPTFPGSLTLTPGDTGLGFVAFQVPASSTLGHFQFALDSGLAAQTGQWRVSAQPPRSAGPGTTPPGTPTQPAEPQPSPPPAAPSSSTGAAEVVEGYYAAINAHDYSTAWALGGQNLVGSYQAFVDGFAGTRQDTLTVVSSDEETVTIELDAEQTDGSHRYFAGTYTVRDGVIVAADIARR